MFTPTPRLAMSEMLQLLSFDGPYEEVSNVLSALGNTMGSTMQMVPSSPMMVKSLAPPPRVQFTITNEDMSFWPEFSDVEDAE